MVLDGGTITLSAATSAVTFVLRLSQNVYEIIAVGEQVQNLLTTTKSADQTMEDVRLLRRRKSHLLMDYEKTHIDNQLTFAQNAVADVQRLIEAQRVDMQTKVKDGVQQKLKSKHIKLHHRVKFVFQDSPKVGTSLQTLGIAMQGLHASWSTLCAKEGHSDASLTVPDPGTGLVGRRGTSPTRKPPPDYELSQFMQRRKTLATTPGREAEQKAKVTFATGKEQDASREHSRDRSDHQSLRSFASWSSANEVFNISSGSVDIENPLLEERSNPQPVNALYNGMLYNGIGSDDHHVYPESRMDASAHPPLFQQHSTPVITRVNQEQQSPRPPPKPLAYKTPQIVLQDEYIQQERAQAFRNSVPYPSSKPLPTLPAAASGHTHNVDMNVSTPSLLSTRSDADRRGEDSFTTPRSLSRRRAMLEYLVNDAEHGLDSTVTHTRSLHTEASSGDRLQQYPAYAREFRREVPGAWPR